MYFCDDMQKFCFFASILSHAIDIVKLLYNWKKKDFRMLYTFIFFLLHVLLICPQKTVRDMFKTSSNMSKQVSQSVMIWPRYITFKNPLDNSGTRVHSSRVFFFFKIIFWDYEKKKTSVVFSFLHCCLFKFVDFLKATWEDIAS